jgi:hypothetical protein
MDAVDGWEAHQIVDREHERPLDEAVDEQCMLGGVDGGHAAMMHFKCKEEGVMMPRASCSGVMLTVTVVA